jgi:hypothetical protein
VKADDARLTAKIKEITERAKKIDELRLGVIKGHLMLEETLDAYLEASMFHPEHLKEARLTFHAKGHLAWAMSLNQDKDTLWYLLWTVNELRNKIAHKLDSDEIEGKMKYVRTSYIRYLSPQQAKHAETLSDPHIAEAACQLCAGFLSTLMEDAKSRRGTIDQHWKSR